MLPRQDNKRLHRKPTALHGNLPRMTGDLIMLAIVDGVLNVLRKFIRTIIRKIGAATCHD